MSLTISSDAFENNGRIPKKYSCDGEKISPPLTIQGVPAGTKTLALIMDDPDAMGVFVHWVVWNIPPAGTIAENSVPGVQGKNSAGRNSYRAPCPPFGAHRYSFRVYALDIELSLDTSSSTQDLEKAMENHILAKAELVGIYKRG